MKKVVVFVEDLYEELELWVPVMRLKEAGVEVVIAGPEEGKTYSAKHGYPCKAEKALRAIKASEFHGVVIPGGYAPDRLRRDSHALEIVRELDAAKKMIAFICHAGWVPISAKILKGKKITGFSAIKDDLVNAGAHFVDQEVVVDGHLITSRMPSDLPAFCKEMVKFMSHSV